MFENIDVEKNVQENHLLDVVDVQEVKIISLVGVNNFYYESKFWGINYTRGNSQFIPTQDKGLSNCRSLWKHRNSHYCTKS